MARLQISLPAAEKQLKLEISLQCTLYFLFLNSSWCIKECVRTLRLKSYLTEGRMYHLDFPSPFFYGLGEQSSFPTFLFPLEIKTFKTPSLLNLANFPLLSPEMLIRWHHSLFQPITLSSDWNFWVTLWQSLHPAHCSEIECWDIWSTLHLLHGAPQSVLRKVPQLSCMRKHGRHTHDMGRSELYFPSLVQASDATLLNRDFSSNQDLIIFSTLYSTFPTFSPPRWTAHCCVTPFCGAWLSWFNTLMTILAFSSHCW